MNQQLTLADIGEFGLIDGLTQALRMPAAVSVGPGDDAAVCTIDGSMVCTTDILVERVHFRREWSTPTDVGRKAVAVNVADLEAMGALPVALVVAFAAPAELSEQWAREFGAGLCQEAEQAGVVLVGGDTTAAGDITVCVTAIGQTQGVPPVLRSGAQAGQLVAVRGELGLAAAGLAVLSRGFRSPRAAVERQRVPQVCYGAGRQAALAGASAMIDVSDGLLADLTHIAQSSQVSIDVESERLPVPEPVEAVASAVGRPGIEFVLSGGEDHALAACFAPNRVPDGWLVVGQVDQPGPLSVTVDGEPWEGPTGWSHFSSMGRG